MRRPCSAAGLLALPVALLTALAGCAQPQPAQEPLLTLARADCDARPDFAIALPVRTEDRRGTPATLGAAGRCLMVPGGAPTTYAVFALPADPAHYTLEILSTVMPRTIVRPAATLYDAAGERVRTIPPEEFETNIAGLRAGVRPHGMERWLVVAADQARLGQTLQLQLSGLDGRVQTAAVVFVPLVFIPPMVPDLVRQRSATFALNGSIIVTAAPARTAQYAAARDPMQPETP